MEQLGMRNYMEDIIKDRMPTVLATMPDLCQCERCQMDRLAYALNNSPPKYVVTSKGKLYAKINVLQGQFDADVVRAITDAAVRVDKSPRHDDEDFEF
ncbi:MAG: late competence development ComFB family protein [Defluviitaleaceae bacterium]|nr:late competence development ComFB family protein [Defluviitaleaceae bacterium]